MCEPLPYHHRVTIQKGMSDREDKSLYTVLRDKEKFKGTNAIDLIV
jgi:hypothetical protein